VTVPADKARQHGETSPDRASRGYPSVNLADKSGGRCEYHRLQAGRELIAARATSAGVRESGGHSVEE